MGARRRSPELHEILCAIVRWAVELLGADGGAVLLYDQRDGRLHHSISRGVVDEYSSITLSPGESLAGRVYESGEPLLIHDYRAWEGRSAAYAPDFPAVTVIGVPLRWGDQTIGVLSVDAAVGKRTFGEDDVRIATVFANVAAAALENARLYDALQSAVKQLRGALWEDLARGTRDLGARSQRLRASLDSAGGSSMPRFGGMLRQIIDLEIAARMLERLSDVLAAETTVALTPREREVLGLVAQGLSNKEIAARLNVTTRTARAHVSNILHKLGAASRTEAAVLAMQSGLLSGDTTETDPF